uniref:Putative ran guanine nucleotide release factor n=1 Tax=Lygus hesperus TaxID=30085 RepID=A0A0A9XKS7_LYGHE
MEVLGMPFLQIQSDLHTNLVRKELYGGVYSIEIPSHFMDLRQFHYVPNHQEVFMDPVNDQSILVDINERSNVEDSDVGIFYSEQNSIDNEASNHTVVETGVVPIDCISNTLRDKDPTLSAMYVISTMDVQKKSCQQVNIIRVYLLIIRLKQEDTDIVITCNIPTTLDATVRDNGGSILSVADADILAHTVLFSFTVL